MDEATVSATQDVQSGKRWNAWASRSSLMTCGFGSRQRDDGGRAVSGLLEIPHQP